MNSEIELVNDSRHVLIQSIRANPSKFSTPAVQQFVEGLQEIGQVLDFPVEGGAQSGRAWAQDASDEDRRFAGLMAGNHELASVWWGDFVLEDWDGSLCHALFMLGFLRGATEACEEMKQ